METAVCISDDKAHYYPGSSVFVTKLIADKATGRLLGMQLLGSGAVDKMTDIASNIKCDNIVAITTPNDSNMPCVLFTRIYTQTQIRNFPATLFTTNSGSFPSNVKKFTGDFHAYNDTTFRFEATVDSTGALRFTVNRISGDIDFGSNSDYTLCLKGEHEF